MVWITTLWPGLPWVWWRGSLAALALSVGYSWLVGLLLLATFVWPELLSPFVRNSLWVVACFAWAGGLGVALRQMPGIRGRIDDAGADDLFLQAQQEYLRGEWIQAESTLKRLLGQHASDVEAILLLATVYRRTRRYRDSRQALVRLERLDGAARWRMEIEQLRAQLGRLEIERPHLTTDMSPPAPAESEPPQHDTSERPATPPPRAA